MPAPTRSTTLKRRQPSKCADLEAIDESLIDRQLEGILVQGVSLEYESIKLRMHHYPRFSFLASTTYKRQGVTIM